MLGWALISTGVVAFAGGVGGPQLRPDLVTEPFAELYVTHSGQRDLLRLSNTIANRGAGPLEILPQEGNSDCDQKPGEDRFAYQRTFTDTDGNGRFARNTDTQANRRVAGCMRFHPQHNHWHFDGFSRYRLKDDDSGQTVAQSTKVGFCVIDLQRSYPGLPGSPATSYYPPDGDCLPDAVEGLSVGWADIYGASLAGQQLNVTGAPKGHYCLVSVADPLNRLRESDESNNVRTKRIFLAPEQDKVRRVSGPCRS